jgi:hypothetical protein
MELDGISRTASPFSSCSLGTTITSGSLRLHTASDDQDTGLIEFREQNSRLLDILVSLEIHSLSVLQEEKI